MSALALGHLGIGGALATAAAPGDSLDGLVARATGTASPRGGLLDAAVDRYGEVCGKRRGAQRTPMRGGGGGERGSVRHGPSGARLLEDGVRLSPSVVWLSPSVVWLSPSVVWLLEDGLRLSPSVVRLLEDGLRLSPSAPYRLRIPVHAA